MCGGIQDAKRYEIFIALLRNKNKKNITHNVRTDGTFMCEQFPTSRSMEYSLTMLLTHDLR